MAIEDYDNYNNPIIKTCMIDSESCYELVKDHLSRFYVNLNRFTIGKREIIAKFNHAELGSYHAFLFWRVLLEETIKPD